MAADDLRGVIDQMKLMQISIESLNPDPAQTIHAYREMRAAQQSAADGLVTATAALVGATTGLGHVGPRPADRGDGREHGLRVDRGAVMASPRIDKVTKVDAARRQISRP